MALKKMCRCGNIIDYSTQYCEECENKVKKIKRDNNKYYDEHIRNKESKEVYNSIQWDYLTNQCKIRFKGLDIYSYYMFDKIEYGFICHHIEDIKDNKDRKYDLENLIYLSSTNHNVIHGLYKKDYEGTKRLLFELINRWKKEIGVI